MKKNWASIVICTASLVVAGIAVSTKTSVAQGGQGGFGGGVQGGPPQGGAGPRNFGGEQGGQRPGGMQFGGMMGGGGSAAIDSDQYFLYVVQGNNIFKVQKSDLKVVSNGQLMQMPAGGPQGFGNAGGQGGQGGRGGNRGGGGTAK